MRRGIEREPRLRVIHVGPTDQEGPNPKGLSIKHASLVTVLATLIVVPGCASGPELVQSPIRPTAQAIPSLAGSYHLVQRGETLWRIARTYGLDPKTLAAANRIPVSVQLKVGQQLFVPLPPETNRFLWPVRGSIGTAGASKGLRIRAPSGTLVRASRSGRVAVATRQLSGWGKTVVLDHLDGFLTIYAGLDQILVAPGSTIRQGTPVGNLGTDALHFEIREGTKPRNVLALLPSE